MSVRSMTSLGGHDVVALDTAESIGAVKHFVISQDGRRIERLHIDGRKKNALFAEWSDLESFGEDRVVVTNSGAPSQSDDERDIDAARGDIDVIGTRILDVSGFERGQVADVEFDSESGEIEAVVSDHGERVTASAVKSLGTYALIVDVPTGT